MIIKVKEKERIKDPGAIAKTFWDVLKTEDTIDRDKEHFWAVGVTSRNAIKYVELVSLGTLNQSLVQPREVFRLAIRKGVANIFVVHNHPSGDPEPSEDDRKVTERLAEAGEILGIKLLDHVIIGKKTFYSFEEHSFLKKYKEV